MNRFILSLIILIVPVLSRAEVILPAVLGDNMVLQRNTEVNLWGHATKGKTVIVKTSWDGLKYKAAVSENGEWSIKVKTGDAGGPYSISFSDGQTKTINNILLGEVWICGGQSNMEMPVCGFMYQPVENAAEHIAEAAEYHEIRMFTVDRVSTDTLRTDCRSEWLTSTPKNVSAFSATGYFFGKYLSKGLGRNIPVGLITSNWGGSTIETWMTTESIDAIEGINHELAKSGKYENSAVSRLYNGMIWPIRNFTSKGFIWYQGCSNRFNWFDYKKLMIALVDLWRKSWNNADMPFYYVQLAPYTYEGDDLRSLAMVIEAQYQAQKEIPNSGIAATTDIGNRTCIHPQNKIKVGQRLAYLALEQTYGIEGLPAHAPTYKSMEMMQDERRGNMLVVSFNNLTEKFAWNEANSLKGYQPDGYTKPEGFEIAGEDKVWHKAEANIRWWENRIEVWSKDVPNPVAVRYAFKNFCREANVMTTLDQPLVPFRTDDWTVDDIGEIR